MLRPKLTTFPFGPELGQGRQVQVEATVALAEAGAATFREGHAAVGVGVGVCVGVGVGVAMAIATVIVTTLVAAQGLAGGKGLVADGARVGLTARAGSGSGG